VSLRTAPGSEEDGCHYDYSTHLKGLTGVHSKLTSGDLCVHTCSKRPWSCAEQHGILQAVQDDEFDGKILQGYLKCLKDGKRDMIPKAVKELTQAAKAAGAGLLVFENCTGLIEEDSCHYDYSTSLKGLTGVHGKLTSGDLCVHTCSEDIDREELDEQKFQWQMVAFDKLPSVKASAIAAAMAATALAAGALIVQAVRRSRVSGAAHVYAGIGV